MKTHYKSFIFCFGVAMLFGALPARATVQTDIQSDSLRVAEWFSREMADMMAFHAATMPLFPGDVLKILGVEVGVAGGLSTSDIDVKGFRSLPLTAFDNQSGVISLPDTIAVPGALVHAKVGLPRGFDLGIKYGTLDFSDDVSDAASKYKNAVYGVEIRKRVLGGDGVTSVALPDVALSLSYDAAKGDVTRTENYNAPLLGAGRTLNANTTWKSEWNVGAVTARAVVSKTLLFITPYAGVGVTQTLGSADSTITTTGTSSPDGAVSLSSTASVDADETLFHIAGGAEIAVLPLIRLSLGYLWSEDNWAASGGFRFQFR